MMIAYINKANLVDSFVPTNGIKLKISYEKIFGQFVYVVLNENDNHISLDDFICLDNKSRKEIEDRKLLLAERGFLLITHVKQFDEWIEQTSYLLKKTLSNNSQF